MLIYTIYFNHLYKKMKDLIKKISQQEKISEGKIRKDLRYILEKDSKEIQKIYQNGNYESLLVYNNFCELEFNIKELKRG